MKRMIAVLMVLGACGGPMPDSGPVTGDAPGDSSGDPASAEDLKPCGADKVQDLVGQPLAGLRDRFAGDARIIPLGGMVTQEYLPRRMNVDLDRDARVARVWCG